VRILQTIVSAAGFRETGYTDIKTRLLDQLASLAAQHSCEVLQVPAGFVIAADLLGADSFIRTAGRISRRRGVAIVGGIDLPGAKRTQKKTKRKRDRRAIENRRLPYLGFATEPSGRCHGLRGSWRQVSTDNRNALYAPMLDVRNRVIGANGARIAVLLCGEMHSKRIRETLEAVGVRAVLVSGHCGLGQGLVPTLRAISSVTGVPSVHSQHLVGMGGRLHFVGARGSSAPRSVFHNLAADEPIWAAAAVRDVYEKQAEG